jgi:aminoglycoside 3-N-acetyltransferase
MNSIQRHDIQKQLLKLGLTDRDTVFVHSSLSSMGWVDGGAESVISAFRNVLGENGTLVVPAFTGSHFPLPGRPLNLTFDPLNDPSEMGRITEEVRLNVDSVRSHHLLHSMSALGKYALDITKVHGASAWAADGPFGKLYELDSYVLMLGVDWTTCTYFHVVEQLVQVSYRCWQNVDALILQSDGTTASLPTHMFTPKPGAHKSDFNKFGSILEEKNLVRKTMVGKAIYRLVKVRDIVREGIYEYRKDPYIFVKQPSME